MKKSLARILFLALALCLVAGGAWAKTLKIGSISPLTGPYAADGTDIKNGVLAAIDAFTASGGVPGYDKIELDAQDDASCDGKQTVAAANKLASQSGDNKIAGVVGAYCSGATIPASEILDEAGIVMISPGSTAEKVTERGLKYMFRTCGRDDDQSKAVGKFMKDFLKAKTVFIVDDKTTYSQGLADNVEKECKALGLTVVEHDHVNAGDRDFSAVLTKVKSANPDVFYISLQNSSSGGLMVSQAKRVGITSKLIAQDAVFHPQLIDNAKEAAEGMYLTFGFIDENSPAYQSFAKIYSAKYGKIGAYSSYAYDAATALLTAIKNSGSTDAEKIRAELLKMDMPGAAKRIKFKENGDSGSNYIVLVIKGGKFVNFWDPETGKTF
jgi:branched-chain amino acid transport system substrate-binding protein